MKKIQFLGLFVLAVFFNSCSKTDTTPQTTTQLPDPQKTLKITSSAFADNGKIPIKYSCFNQTAPYSLPLAWDNIPSGTQSFVLLMTDLDGSPSPIDHWLIYNIPASITSIAEKQSFGSTNVIDNVDALTILAYTTPCPKQGNKTHHYQISIYALNTTLPLTVQSYTSSSDLLTALKGKALAYGTLTGTYDIP